MVCQAQNDCMKLSVFNFDSSLAKNHGCWEKGWTCMEFKRTFKTSLYGIISGQSDAAPVPPPVGYQGPPAGYQQGPQTGYQQGPPSGYQQGPPGGYQQPYGPGQPAPYPQQVVVAPIGPDELPPPYTPTAPGASLSINCKVCQAIVCIDGRQNQNVIKCHVCHEATVSFSVEPVKTFLY